MFKKDMKPLTKGGSTTAHAGKGSTQMPMAGSARSMVSQSGATAPGANMNNFAKATPMAQPQANPQPPDGGLGTGNWGGIGVA